METAIQGKRVLLVQGSSLASDELFDALCEAGAKPYPTSNLLNAFTLVERVSFDAALIDQGLHNEAFDLCAELQERGIPYVSCAGPHRLQGPAARRQEAQYAIWRLGALIGTEDGAGFTPQAVTTPESRAS